MNIDFRSLMYFKTVVKNLVTMQIKTAKSSILQILQNGTNKVSIQLFRHLR